MSRIICLTLFLASTLLLGQGGSGATLAEQARALVKKNRLNAACDLYAKALSLDAGNWRLYHEASQAEGMRRRFHIAVTYLRTARAIAPSEPKVLHDLAATLQNQSQYLEALDVWRALEAELSRNMDQAVKRPNIPLNRGFCAEKGELAPEAIEAYHRSAQWSHTPKDKVAALKSLGALLFNRGEFEESLKHMKQAITLAPGEADPHYFAGSAHAALGKHEKAIESLLIARRLDDKAERIDIRLGSSYAALGERGRAQTYLMEAARKNPQSHRPWYLLRQIHMQMGDDEQADAAALKYKELRKIATDHEEALRSLERRIKANRKDSEAYFEIANTYLQNQRFEEGIEYLNRLLAEDPRHVLARLNTAGVLYQQKNLRGALYEVEQAIEIEPMNPFANLSAAQFMIRANQLDRAVTTSQRSVQKMDKKDPRFIEALRILAVAASRVKKHDLALGELMLAADSFEGQPDKFIPITDLIVPLAAGATHGRDALPVLEKGLRAIGPGHPKAKEAIEKAIQLAEHLKSEEYKSRFSRLLN